MFKLPTEGQKLTRLVLWLMGKATAQDAQCEIKLVYFQSNFTLMCSGNGPGAGHCTYVEELEEAPGSHFWIASDLIVAAIWGVKTDQKTAQSPLSLKSAFHFGGVLGSRKGRVPGLLTLAKPNPGQNKPPDEYLSL